MPLSELKRNARKLMAENAPKLFFISIIFIVIISVMTELEFNLPGTNNASTVFLERVRQGEIPTPTVFYSNLRLSGLAFACVLMLLHPVIEVGFMRYCLKIMRGQSGDYMDIFDGFLFFVKILLIHIITSILIFLWSMLFIVPGIVASYKYSQSYYILLDSPEKGALQCIQESKRMMEGHKLDLFLLNLSFIGWKFLDIAIASTLILLFPIPFSLPLLSIWLTPYIGLTHAAYYNHLREGSIYAV